MKPEQTILTQQTSRTFGTKVWLLAESEHAYVLKCYIYVCVYIYIYIYEGAKYDRSSGIAGAGYNVVYVLMEMGKSFDNCHYLFTDNLFATCAAANYLLEQGTFMKLVIQG